MRACVFDEFGDSSRLQIRELEKPRPREGELLIAVHASGVNPVDYKIREGLFGKTIPHEFPVIPGWEMAGVVEESGYSARRFKPGDEVFGLARRPVIHAGTYSEYICIPESYVTLKPWTFSLYESAAIPLCGLTAYQCLFDAVRLTSGQTILILGASGGVGTFAIQLAKIIGARVIAISSGPNLDYVSELGADVALDYNAMDYPETVKKVVPQGADVILDCVGKEAARNVYGCVRSGGRFVSIVSRHVDPILVEKAIEYHYVFVEPNSTQLDRLAELADDSKFRVHVSKTFSLDEAALAQNEIAGGHTRGKIVIKIGE